MTSIDCFRHRLLGQRRALLATVAGVEAELAGLQDEVEIEEGERGQEEAVARLLDRLDERERAELAAVDAALARIGRGEYGRCERCGEPISPARLDALPTATTCLRCAEEGEPQVRLAHGGPR